MTFEEENDEHKERLRALNKVADYLARRDHSELELRTKLGKHFESSTIDWAIQEAQESNWLGDPQEIAERAALSLHRKRKGYLYIKRFLKEKGLPNVNRDETLEYEKAEDLLQDKFGKFSDFSYEEKQKAFRFLINRGFEDSLIKDIIF